MPESQDLSKARKKMIYHAPTYVISHLEACLTVSSVHPENELRNRKKNEKVSDLAQTYSVVLIKFSAFNDILLGPLIFHVMTKTS